LHVNRYDFFIYFFGHIQKLIVVEVCNVYVYTLKHCSPCSLPSWHLFISFWSCLPFSCSVKGDQNRYKLLLSVYAQIHMEKRSQLIAANMTQHMSLYISWCNCIFYWGGIQQQLVRAIPTV